MSVDASHSNISSTSIHVPRTMTKIKTITLLASASASDGEGEGEGESALDRVRTAPNSHSSHG